MTHCAFSNTLNLLYFASLLNRSIDNRTEKEPFCLMTTSHNLIVKAFKKENDLTLFEEAQKIRFNVFVDEQNVSPNHEIDALDDTATHFVVMASALENDTEDTALFDFLATGRMFPESAHPDKVRLGRMAVKKAYRGQGLGSVLIKAILKKAKTQGYKEAVCGAQTHALKYYEKFGFVAEGKEFLEENIPHFLMRCSLL